MVSEDLKIRFCEVTQELAKAYHEEGKRWGDLDGFIDLLVNQNVRYLSYLEATGGVETFAEYLKDQYAKESE